MNIYDDMCTNASNLPKSIIESSYLALFKCSCALLAISSRTSLNYIGLIRVEEKIISNYLYVSSFSQDGFWVYQSGVNQTQKRGYVFLYLTRGQDPSSWPSASIVVSVSP